VLKLTDVDTHYGRLPVLKSVCLEVRVGEIVCLLGGNASGKSTTMKTILGVVRPTAGRVEFEGDRIDGLATEVIARRGISLVPEARRIFARMTVWENLSMGAFTRQKAPAGEVAEDFERVWALFPRLLERQHQLGGTLSGEHGDGKLRTPLMPRVWSADALARFAAIKQAFDPKDLLNPGKKVPVSS